MCTQVLLDFIPVVDVINVILLYDVYSYTCKLMDCATDPCVWPDPLFLPCITQCLWEHHMLDIVPWLSYILETMILSCSYQPWMKYAFFWSHRKYTNDYLGRPAICILGHRRKKPIRRQNHQFITHVLKQIKQNPNLIIHIHFGGVEGSDLIPYFTHDKLGLLFQIVEVHKPLQESIYYQQNTELYVRLRTFTS